MRFHSASHFRFCWLFNSNYKVASSAHIVSYRIYLCGIYSSCASSKLKPDYASIFCVQKIFSHMIKAIVISVVSGVFGIWLPRPSDAFAYERNEPFRRAWFLLIRETFVTTKIEFLLHET
jgi:hypothetical protein